MYDLFKKCLFALDPEQAHTLALTVLQILYRSKLSVLFSSIPQHPTQIMGLQFKNRIGLAAGFDKNADYIEALAALGFGFIEVGTITPQPQKGNPRPRLFRLTEQEAIINRMGFNNKGADYAAWRLAKTHYRGILGINIGKNSSTPPAKAIDDYLICFHKLARFASYITLNISSPNTPGLRDLQQAESLTDLLSALKQAQAHLQQTQHRYVPLVVKISPDLTLSHLTQIAEILLAQKIDGVIATNTTIDRSMLGETIHAQQAGGLSGAPLQQTSTYFIRHLHTILQDHIPIIASGGIMDEISFREKFQAGAKLVQIYSGLIYQGPALLKRLGRLD